MQYINGAKRIANEVQKLACLYLEIRLTLLFKKKKESDRLGTYGYLFF